jgi:Rhodanese-related sulfurtransferase
MVDLRPAIQFAAAHLPGAVNVPNGKSFLAWSGAVLPPDRDLVLFAADTERPAAQHAARELALIGFDRVLGVVAAGDAGAMSATLPSVPAASLGAQAPASATLLDVRNPSEWSEGHVPGARHIPLTQLAARMDELRGAGPLLVHCQGGSRSAVAASLLQANGFTDVANVAGGFSAWERAGHTPERDG